MSRNARIVIGLLGFVIAQSLLVLGVGLWLDKWTAPSREAVGLACVALSALLAMWLVIDPLVPDAGRWFTRAIKLLVFAVLMVSATLSVCEAQAGPYELPWLS